MESTEILVVGAGLAGSATAWRLAQRGVPVTLVERDVPASRGGSSHGSARILRFAYPEQEYVALLLTAVSGWHELEAAHGTPLLTPAEALNFGGDPRELADVLDRAGIPHELVTQRAARERWPGVAADTDVLVHDGSVIDAENAVRAMVDAARAAGAEVHTGWSLARLERTPTGFRAVAADGRTVDAGRVVVACGGWLPDLLDRLTLPTAFVQAFPVLDVKEENAFHFPYRDADGELWPTTIQQWQESSVYSLPGGRDAGFRGQKVAEYNVGRSIRSAAGRSETVVPANRARVIDYVREYLPGLSPEPYAETTCLFTNTPTEDFVIDSVEGVTVVSPCSGHGAKFAPQVGELAADSALGTGTVPDRFRVGRASGRSRVGGLSPGR